MTAPGRLALPSSKLQVLDLPIAEKNISWFRTHGVEFGPAYYGRAKRNRFDAPEGEYGVLYVAEDAFGAFIESFGQLAGNAPHLPRAVTSGMLASRALSAIRCHRPLRLVDLTGRGLARIGADARLFSGEHEVAREWSKSLHRHPNKVDGIYYPVRHDPSRRAAAIFNESLEWVDLSRDSWLAQGLLLRDVLKEYDFALIESEMVKAAIKKGPSKQQSLHFGKKL